MPRAWHYIVTKLIKICEITALADHNCALSTDNNGGGGPHGQAAPGVNAIRSALFRRRHTTPPQAQATARQASAPALPAHTGTREQRNRPGCQRPILHKYQSYGNNIMAFAILFVFLHRATGGAKHRPHSLLRPQRWLKQQNDRALMNNKTIHRCATLLLSLLTAVACTSPPAAHRENGWYGIYDSRKDSIALRPWPP